MNKQEAMSATIYLIRQIAEDAKSALEKLTEESSCNVVFQASEDLSAQAHNIYRLAVRLQTLEATGNLIEGKEQK